MIKPQIWISRCKLEKYSIQMIYSYRKLDKPPFQAFCIGLPKTGTTSVARIFRRCRAGHEVAYAQSVSQIIKRNNGQLTKNAFERFILARVRENQLAMDSSSFHHYYLNVLCDRLPRAKFIITVRDFQPWINSYLNMLLCWRQGFGGAFKHCDWQTAYGKLQFGAFDPDDFASVNALKRNLSSVAERFYRFWACAYQRISRNMDSRRSLIIDTSQLSNSIERIAGFIGIPSLYLDPAAAHSNRRKNGIDWIKFIDDDRIQMWRRRYGTCDLLT